MDKTVFSSGDNNEFLEPVDKTDSLSSDRNKAEETIAEAGEASEEEGKHDIVTTKNIDSKEIQLKERIDQCKNIIASLKLELDEEKSKLEKETRLNNPQQNEISSNSYNINSDFPNDQADKLLFTSNMFAATVHSKLICDENLIEYEKQLQKYQNTLNMAQVEKKNAIRKQMLAKAYKLKLLEVENQCNVELLRIKQSLQCLEPLKTIVEKWKTARNENEYDLNNFELIPRYPELSPNTESDVSINFNKDNA